MEGRTPILIAYDGSEAARAAVREAGALFSRAPAIVVTVWEPGLTQLMLVPDPTGMGGTFMPYDPSVVHEIERVGEEHAQQIADEGARLAGEAGLAARALLAEDSATPAEAIVAAADAHEARAIVIGSRGLRGLRSKLLGSTSSDVLRHARQPVVVVRHPEDHAAHT